MLHPFSYQIGRTLLPTLTHPFCILLQINLKIWIKGKDTLEHVFMTVNVHLAGHNNTWIPWLHDIRSHLIISVWWYTETGIKTYAFQSKKSSIKQHFLNCGLCTKSLSHDFIKWHQGILLPSKNKPQIPLNTFQIQWNKSLHTSFNQTHLSFGSCEKEDMLKPC